MRLIHAALVAPFLLMACANEPAPAPPTPVAQPAQPDNRVIFPSQAEIAAGRAIRIRPAANFGIYGPLQPMPGANACGVLQDSQTGRALAVASTQGAVTPVFNIAGQCPRRDAIRGVPFVRMDNAWILSNGIYMRGAQMECFLPNVGRNAVCVPRGAQPG